ncbi:MAG TPA: AAA family ATPase, partial [Minicystis sp.]|nr:AAA family ATPase [Minicystis sp.]
MPRLAPAPLFGREGDLDAIASRFAEGARVVTLHGPGGVGKTSLARRFAAGAPHVFCDLTEARDDDVARVVAHALGAKGKDAALAAAVDAANARGEVLVVLDNAEQAIEGVARAAATIASGAPRARLLVTSREPLRIAGEHVHPVAPLGVPEPGGDVQATDAGRLFVARARAVRPSFDVARAGAAVAAIVRRLDGLPLAIELAAARVRVLDPAELAARLERGVDAL